MALTKNDIVIKVHEIGLTKKAAVDAVETLIEIIKQTLEDEEAPNHYLHPYNQDPNPKRSQKPA